jgi:uncharacterized protein YggE
MRKLQTILFLFLFNFAVSQIQNTGQTSFIEVTGTAKREIEPNQIHVSITLTEKSIDNKKYTIENQENKLHEILTELNIPKSKLTLSDFSSSIITEKRKEIGFKQTKLLNLILDNGQQVSNLFEKLFEANIKEADVIKIDHTEMVKYNKEVRIEALQAAKTKAEYLLNSINNKIGKPLEIIEENVSDNYFRANTYNVKVNIPSETSEFKKIVISFSYKVKYQIE